MSPRTGSTAGKNGKGKPAELPALRVAAAPSRSRAGKRDRVSPDIRQRYIAEAAYFKAEKRGFAQGGELGDWIDAEAEVDALLGAKGSA
jgi:hypothetical protein